LSVLFTAYLNNLSPTDDYILIENSRSHRLSKNTIRGLCGVDMAILVVAADDGVIFKGFPMAQII
jgi:Selenocysteine-specific translation elongation factor